MPISASGWRTNCANQPNISTVAGTGTPGFSGGGPGINAKLYDPFGIGIAPGDKLYIAEGAGRRVRVLQLSSGIITTAAS